MRIILSISIGLILMLSSATSLAQKKWFLDLDYGLTESSATSSAAVDVLVYRPIGGSSCISPPQFNPCVGDYQLVSPEPGDGNVLGIHIGRRLNDYFSLNLGYLGYKDLDNERRNSSALAQNSTSTFTADLDGFEVGLSGDINVSGPVSLIGKISVFNYDLRVEQSTEFFDQTRFIPGLTRNDLDFGVDITGGPARLASSENHSGSAFSYAAGIAIDLNAFWQIRLTYQHFNELEHLELNNYSLALRFRF